MDAQNLAGSFRILVLYDVAEEIDLAELRHLLGVPEARREPSFTRRAPDYVRFERPPVVEPVEGPPPPSGESLQASIKYYDYGVVSLELAFDFSGPWAHLIELANRWIASSEVELWSEQAARRRLEHVSAALRKPYEHWLSEDYCVIHVRQALGADGRPVSGQHLLENHGGQISQIVRGEAEPLAEDERKETLQGAASYFPQDLTVVGWTAAFIYDTPVGAEPAFQLLEYANTQLLEYRHYDVVLTQVLEDVYRSLDQGTGWLKRWRMARQAARLNTIRLDVRELTERTDNSLKFLSDMFYARSTRSSS